MAKKRTPEERERVNRILIENAGGWVGSTIALSTPAGIRYTRSHRAAKANVKLAKNLSFSGKPEYIAHMKHVKRTSFGKKQAIGIAGSVAGAAVAYGAYKGGKAVYNKTKPKVVSYKKRLPSGKTITVKRKSANKKRR